MSDDESDHEDGYAGPAVLTVDGRDVPVQVLLDARHEPQDGKLHWFGRVTLPGDVPDELTRTLTSATGVELSTTGGRSPARVGDVDMWGRYRVTGTGPLPYALDDPDLRG